MDTVKSQHGYRKKEYKKMADKTKANKKFTGL